MMRVPVSFWGCLATGGLPVRPLLADHLRTLITCAMVKTLYNSQIPMCHALTQASHAGTN